MKSDETENKAIEFYKSKNPNEQLSFEFCKNALNQNGINYSDEELKIIVAYLYQTAELAIRCVEQQHQKHSTKIIELKKSENEESYSLHPSEYRRAS